MSLSFQKKGQAAVEFLMVVGVAFTMLVPAFFLFSMYSETSNQIIIASQIDRMGKEMIANIESIYYYGKHSKTTLKVNFPKRIQDIYLNPRLHYPQDTDDCMDDDKACLSEIVFETDLFSAGGDNSHFVYFTHINVSADFTGELSEREAVTQGLKTFTIESYGDYVNISRRIS